MEVRPLQPEDLEKLRTEAVEDIKSYPEFDYGEFAWSAWDKGILIGAGGVRIFWEGVSEGWLIISRNSPDESKVRLVLAFRKKLKELIEEHGLWRVQATVSAKFEKGISLLRTLGFEYEGTMRKYAPDGSDMMIYAKVI